MFGISELLFTISIRTRKQYLKCLKAEHCCSRHKRLEALKLMAAPIITDATQHTAACKNHNQRIWPLFFCLWWDQIKILRRLYPRQAVAWVPRVTRLRHTRSIGLNILGRKAVRPRICTNQKCSSTWLKIFPNMIQSSCRHQDRGDGIGWD